MALRKAERRKAKIRVGIFGPSGSGKTFSALIMARGMASAWDKIAIIDTEHGSADLYCHLGEYNVCDIEAPFTPEKYIAEIEACEKAGMEVIIIDSISHEWDGKGGLLESNELLAQTKFRGNTWSAWSVTTPRHQRFIEAITNSKCHVIACGRSKTDTIQTEDKKIKKVGMKEITRDGFEYEMTIGFTLDRSGHYATASKDRTGIFIDLDPFVITEETGQAIMEWCERGIETTPSPASPPAAEQAVAPKPPAPVPAQDILRIEELMRELNIPENAQTKTWEMLKNPANAPIILAQLELKLRQQIEEMKEEAAPEPPTTPEEPEEAPATVQDAREVFEEGKQEASRMMEEVKALLVPSTSKTPLTQLEEVFARYCGKDVKPETATLTQLRIVRKALMEKRKEQEAATEAAA